MKIVYEDWWSTVNVVELLCPFPLLMAIAYFEFYLVLLKLLPGGLARFCVSTESSF